MKTRILTATIAALLAASPVFAVTYTWDGNFGGGDSNLTTGINWVGNPATVVSDLATTDLIFAGNSKLTPNVSAPFSARIVTFDNTAAAFTIGSTNGSTLTVGSGGIVNGDSNTQIFTANVAVGSATSTFNASFGELTFSGTVGLGANALSVTGGFNTSFANLSSTGSVTKTGMGIMTWAPTTTTSADITVSTGVLQMGADGSPDIFDGGASIAVNGTGTLLINENMVLDGGAQMTRQATGILKLASGKTLTVQGGSDFIVTGNFGTDILGEFDGDITVSGAGSSLQTSVGGSFAIPSGRRLSVQSAGSGVLNGNLLLGAFSGGPGYLSVAGIGSALTVQGETRVSISGDLEFATGASVNLNTVTANSGFTSAMRVLSGATVLQSGNLLLEGAASGSFTNYLTIADAGTVWVQTGASSTALGAATGAPFAMHVQNSSMFTSGYGTFTLNLTATVNIDGGTLDLRGPLLRNGGALNFTSGALSIVDNFNVGAGGLLGSNVTLGATRHFTTSATTTVDAFQTLTLSGGTLRTGALVNNGTLAFTSGTLAVTGASGFNIGTGALGANVTLGAGMNLAVTNTTTVASGAALTLNGGALSGGALANGGLITGAGTVGMALSNNSGGEVRAAASGRLVFNGAAGNSGTGRVEVSAGGDLQFQSTLANASAIDVIGGTFRVDGAATNAASTGRLTGRNAILRFNGGLANSGSLAFSFGTSDVFGDITNTVGTGRIVVSGNSNVTFYDDLVNSGSVQVSTGSTAVYFGAVSGAGSFPGGGTNFFEGDLAPGASPALVTFGGNVVYGTFMTLHMELGGTARGTGYDAINVAGNLGLNGTLNVPLIGGFQPEAGHVFNLFDWGTRTGTFSTVNLPALNPGLLWSQANLYSAGEIQVTLDAAFTGRVWDGGGADNAWATDHNWDLNVEPLNTGTAQLVFAGTTRLTPSVDTPWNVASITFDNTAGVFTITGPQGITIGAGGITNNDADTQTITAALTLSASETFTAAVGDLEVSSVAIGGHVLTLAGANDVILDSATGTGTITKTGAGTLTVNGALRTSGIVFNANEGATNFTTSQTFAALNIGTNPLSAGAASVVPEPSCTLLAGAGLALLGLRRRGR